MNNLETTFWCFSTLILTCGVFALIISAQRSEMSHIKNDLAFERARNKAKNQKIEEAEILIKRQQQRISGLEALIQIDLKKTIDKTILEK